MKKSECTIPQEHERRFVPVLANLPFNPHLFPVKFITQGYLGDGGKTRLRHEFSANGQHTYLLTRKTGEGVSRTEDEREIPKGEFDEMWKRVQVSLKKNRYYIHWEGIDLELNTFYGTLATYFQIEVEFDSNEAAVAFVPPEWLGREVTYDKNHGNYALAKYGIPKG